jgi:hypothetical protein
MDWIKLKLKSSNWSTLLLYLLLATDVIFILLHLILHQTDFLGNSSFSLEKDRGYPEFFQYLKEYWIAILFILLTIRMRSLFYLSWSLLFLYLLLDDSCQIHEKGGKYISELLEISPFLNLRAVDFGELIVSTLAGLTFFTLIAISYRFGDSSFRNLSKSLIVMIVALALTGIVVDMIHIAVPSSWEFLFGTIEDGGEHIVMSVIVWFTFVFTEQLQLEKDFPTLNDPKISYRQENSE